MAAHPPPKILLGLMSGTSMDGIDIASIPQDFVASGSSAQASVNLKSYPYAQDFKQQIQSCLEHLQLRESLELRQKWSLLASEAVRSFLQTFDISEDQVLCLGVHGPTIAHQPPSKSSFPFSFQANDISTMAYQTQLRVVGNFRNGDIAAGGEGAPLAPFGHKLLFPSDKGCISVHNLGGISNLSLLKDGEVLQSFDTGPANMWMDLAIRYKTHEKQGFDKDGALASSGKFCKTLLNALLCHPYFSQNIPKSTGWEDFGAGFIERHRQSFDDLSLEDLMATLCEATAESIAQAYQRFVLPTYALEKIVLCGGGSQNLCLKNKIQQKLGIEVSTSESYGLPSQGIEAICFALLAFQFLNKKTNSEPSATGAREANICGELALPPKPK